MFAPLMDEFATYSHIAWLRTIKGKVGFNGFFCTKVLPADEVEKAIRKG